MKTIELKSLDAGDGSAPVEYVAVLRDVVRQPLNRQAGVDITEMRQSLRVLDALDAANGTLELEDADYEHLKTKLDAMNWNVVDARIIQLVDDVNGA